MIRTDNIIQYIKKFIPNYLLIIISALSLALFLWEISRWETLGKDILNNAITLQEQTQILQATFILLIILTLLSLIKTASLYAESLKDTALRLMPCLFLLPLVLHKEIFRANPLVMASLVTFLSFYVYATLKRTETLNSPSLKNISKTAVYGLLILAVLGYALYFSYYTIINHYHFKTQTFDFGFYQNAFVNTLHGKFMGISFVPFNGANVFRDHCDFILLLYLPFFYFFPKAETLLAVQSFSIAIAAIPLFLLSKHLLKSNWIALLLALIFLLHPANHGPNFYDIHQLSFLSLFVFCLFYFMEKNKPIGFIISLLFILSIKADMFILMSFISLFIYVNNTHHLRFAKYCFLGSAIYGLAFICFLNNWLMHPFFYHYEGIMNDKSGGLSEILKTIITNPIYILTTLLTKDKILYVFQIFGPLAFTPLFRKQNYILFIYGGAVTLLGTKPGFHEIYFQYAWYILPFLFIGSLYVLRDLQKQTPIKPAVNIRALLTAVAIASFIYSWQYGALLNKDYFKGGFVDINFKFSSDDKKRLQALNDAINRIPRSSSVATDGFLSPHLPGHPNMFLFNLDETKADYLLLFDPDTSFPKKLEDLKNNKKYNVIYNKDGFQLLKKS